MNAEAELCSYGIEVATVLLPRISLNVFGTEIQVLAFLSHYTSGDAASILYGWQRVGGFVLCNAIVESRDRMDLERVLTGAEPRSAAHVSPSCSAIML